MREFGSRVSCKPVHAPPGRGTLPVSLWDVTQAQETLGLVEAACWMRSWSVLLWPSRNPKPLPGALQGGLQRSEGVLEDAFVLVHAGVQDPGLLLLPQGQKQLLPLAHASVSPSVPNQEEIFSQRCSAKRWLVVGARLRNGSPGGLALHAGAAHVCSSPWSGCRGQNAAAAPREQGSTLLCPTSTHLSTAKWLERRGAELPHPSLKALQVPASTLKSPCAWEEIPSCPQQHF